MVRKASLSPLLVNDPQLPPKFIVPWKKPVIYILPLESKATACPASLPAPPNAFDQGPLDGVGVGVGVGVAVGVGVGVAVGVGVGVGVSDCVVAEAIFELAELPAVL